MRQPDVDESGGPTVTTQGTVKHDPIVA